MMAIERPFRGARQRLRSKLGGLWPLHMALRRWAPRLPCLVERVSLPLEKRRPRQVCPGREVSSRLGARGRGNLRRELLSQLRAEARPDRFPEADGLGVRPSADAAPELEVRALSRAALREAEH